MAHDILFEGLQVPDRLYYFRLSPFGRWRRSAVAITSVYSLLASFKVTTLSILNTDLDLSGDFTLTLTLIREVLRGRSRNWRHR